jgi:hypothetical protein
VAIAILVACASLLAVSGSASAGLIGPLGGKRVSGDDGHSVFRCVMKVQKVDLNAGVTTLTVDASIRPKSPAGYYQNAHVHTDCWVLPAGDTNPADALALVSADGGNRASNQQSVVVPFADTYTLCGRGLTVLRNADTAYSPYLCK